VANLVCHVQSGNYYARIRVRGKLIWKSLKPDRIGVAKLRLSDFHREERQRASAQKAVARGKMIFADALANLSGATEKRSFSQGTQQSLSRRTNHRPFEIMD
jgi:hypothetical protein